MITGPETMTCTGNEVSDVFIDGPFKYCEKFFFQMNNIHELYNGQMFL